MTYQSLNDAARRAEELAVGPTKIWYLRPDQDRIRDTARGMLSPAGFLFDPARPEVTHACLGGVVETDFEHIFCLMQGESWSPEGEARELIARLGLAHTSMSPGDVIESEGKFYICEWVGFKELPLRRD